MSKNYCVGILYNKTLTELLLLFRLKEPYKGRLNGIGGHVEEGETPGKAMRRECIEETGIDAILNMQHVCTFSYSNGVILNAYALQVDLDNFNEYWDKAVEEGTLEVFKTDSDLLYDVRQNAFAGDGNLPFIIFEGLNLLRKGMM